MPDGSLMVIYVTTAAIYLATLLGIVLWVLLRPEKPTAAPLEVADPSSSSNLPDGLRVEMVFADWGERFGADRYRWAVFDADARVRPGDVVMGADYPYLSGNEATRAQAEIRALDAAQVVQRWVKAATDGSAKDAVVLGMDVDDDQ